MYINSHVIVERYSELFIDVPNSAIILEIPIQICVKIGTCKDNMRTTDTIIEDHYMYQHEINKINAFIPCFLPTQRHLS